MRYSNIVNDIFSKMISLARENKYEYITPEHLLFVITFNNEFEKCFNECGGSTSKLRIDLEKYIGENFKPVEEAEPQISYNLREVLNYSENKARNSQRDVIELTHILDGIMSLSESYAKYFMLNQGIEWTELLAKLCDNGVEEKSNSKVNEESSWQSYVTLLNDKVDEMEPLIGRKSELERTIQILCRKYKNNPIHVGEAGVGKTSITYGLIKLINKGEVPDRLKNSKVYALDIGTLIAGTQFRGDFEKKFKMVMDGLLKEDKPIVYIDEIHNIVGAGATNGGTLDASNMLKPYLTNGKIRVIGATTYDEYNKYFSKSKSLLRRFQKVDILEPSVSETVEILNGLKKYYEEYHHVKYGKDTLEYAVNLSDKYINDRALPDKAIDLIDEAGAYRVMHPLNKKVQTVDKKLIEEVLSKTCNIPKKTVESNEIKKIALLDKKLKSKVFGQDNAIDEVVNAIKLSRAGLNEDNKPIASLLFVGPTGVGKTEIARSLADILDVKLIRFDMSEYMEKHSVAKLIGSPAGYVGYEEGGLLTDEVRKNPHSVLLLDEIEKAHTDVFNILLQVMDYATLTDNKGKKTDFRNCIIIMTSNAGASKLNKSLIGFGDRILNEDTINESVKKTFSPEFRNRLSKIVVFNSLNNEMCKKIVNKNIKLLKEKLVKKDISLTLTKACTNYLIEKGISKEYGAREIARVIDREIKPVLVNEILFGKLKKGGKCSIDYVNKEIKLKIK